MPEPTTTTSASVVHPGAPAVSLAGSQSGNRSGSQPDDSESVEVIREGYRPATRSEGA